ncbi:DNA polymerase IV 1 [Clostridia bacterium]|nr:DNA polymerase IV 1 [Clostridia bacterium]
MRTIFHSDLNAFYASVEEILHPEYKKIPMAVCGDPASRRGIILAKNELAKKAGVKTAETIWQAKQKCKNLKLAPPHRDLYYYYYEKINAIYEEYTEQVERCGIDESFLDVTGSLNLFKKTPLELAHEIRIRAEKELGLTVSIGVSWNKIFAKLGSDYKKPNAVTIFDKNNWQELIFPLPASDMLMVGKRTAEALQKMAIFTIGDLAKADENKLVQNFGKLGEVLHICANGLDDSPVANKDENEAVQSVGNGLTFKRNLISESDIKTALLALSDSVARRMRKQGVKCRVVQITIKNPELKSITRQKQIAKSTNISDVLANEASQLLQTSWQIGKPIRMLTVTAQHLVSENEAEAETSDVATNFRQLSLFDLPKETQKSNKTEKTFDTKSDAKKEKLEFALDNIREKYGVDVIERASVAKNDFGLQSGKYNYDSD